MPGIDYFAIFNRYVGTLKGLTLASDIPLAKIDGPIQTVFAKHPVPADDDSKWEIFDKRLNALYSEDLRADGLLPNIERGQHGLDAVISYLEATVASRPNGFQWSCAIPKIQRLVKEVKSRGAMTATSSAPANSLPPARTKPVPKAKAASIASTSTSKSGKTTGISGFFSGKRKGGPTDEAAASSKRKKTTVSVPSDSESSDSDYDPGVKGKRGKANATSSDEDEDLEMMDGNGEEVLEDSDAQKALEIKRKAKCDGSGTKGVVQALVSKVKSAVSKKGKKTSSVSNKSKATSTSSSVEPTVIDSGEESDGDTALKKAEAAAAKPQAARRGPANQSMQHYKKPVATDVPGYGWRWDFECDHCGAHRTFPRTVDAELEFDDEPSIPAGFNNLATHLKGCKKLPKDGQAKADNADPLEFNYAAARTVMDKFLLEGQLNPAVVANQKGFLRIFAAWILDMDLPWTTGEAPLLAALFRYLKVRFYLPSDTTVRNELARLFAELHSKVVFELSEVESKIAFATDTWTNKQMVYTFACSIATFINEDWELVERVIDFKPLESKEHEGVWAAASLVKSARAVGALNKMTLAMDNASVNDVIFKKVVRALLTLYDIPTPARDDHRHIRCLAHVINLVVQAILSALDEAEVCHEDGDEDDQHFASKQFPIDYDPEDDTDLQEFEAHRDNDLESGASAPPEDDDAYLHALLTSAIEEDASGTAGLSALKRLRFIVTKITSSPQRRQKFWAVSLERYGKERRADPKNRNSALLHLLMVIRDVRTRWNSTHAMIKRALLLREAINGWVLAHDEFHGVLLLKKDWDQLEELCNVLEPFADATKQLSGSKYPTIPFVLPIYHGLEQKLIAMQCEDSLSDAMATALEAGHTKLTKYKGPAFKNNNYILATALHPSLRSAWFRRLAPPSDNLDVLRRAQDEAVKKVEILVESVAQTYQEEMEAKAALDASKAACSSTAGKPKQSASRPLTGGGSLQGFYDFDIAPIPITRKATSKEKLRDELRRYFAFEGGMSELLDPLKWWKEHRSSFPVLAKMAKDILAIPATSVSVERTFSKSRQICSDLRSALHSETVRMALLTKTWINSNLFDLVPKEKKVVKHGSTALL